MRSVAAFLAAITLAVMLPVAAMPALAASIDLPTHYFGDTTKLEGTIGGNLSWTLDKTTGLLKVTGSGDMTEFVGIAAVPWYNSSTYVKNVVIGSDVTSIGKYAFNECTELESVTFEGNAVKKIGRMAFYNCKKLSDITLPTSLTQIDASAFEKCSSITSVTVPSGVTTVGESAFLLCTGLKTVKLMNGVETVGFSAFEDCAALETVVIPASVKSLVKYAFSSCANLKTIIYCGTEDGWNAVQKGTGWAFDSNYTVQYHSYSYCTCTECGYFKGHAFDNGAVTKEPTYTDTGIMTYTCTECGTTKTTVIPKLVLPGDVSGDGLVTNADVLAIYRYIFDPVLYPLVNQ